MSQHRLYYPHRIQQDAQLTLDGDRAHYLLNVLRLRDGDQCALFDGSGSEYPATIIRRSKKNVELAVGTGHLPQTESALHVVLAQSLLRGERMDLCVQKATELGVRDVVPLITARTVAKLPAARVEKRLRHWRNIAISAAEQSGRTRVPTIHAPSDLSVVLDRDEMDRQFIVMDPWNDAPAIHTLPAPGTSIVVACVGPEGGFTSEEIEQCLAAGARRASFGPRVLRSETAGIMAVAACQMVWGDWRRES